MSPVIAPLGRMGFVVMFGGDLGLVRAGLEVVIGVPYALE